MIWINRDFFFNLKKLYIKLLFNKWLGQLDVHMQKRTVIQYLIPYKKSNLIVDINVKQSSKTYRRKQGKKLRTWLDKDFLDTTLKTCSSKEQIDQLDCIKI